MVCLRVVLMLPLIAATAIFVAIHTAPDTQSFTRVEGNGREIVSVSCNCIEVQDTKAKGKFVVGGTGVVARAVAGLEIRPLSRVVSVLGLFVPLYDVYLEGISWMETFSGRCAHFWI